jgi:hypothetical protein
MISKRLRIRIFNWLGAGKLTIVDDTKENKMTTGPYTYGTNTLNISPSVPQIDIKGGINFTVAQATGGWIVQINHRSHIQNESPDLYIIPEDADFDRELGKIITMSCLKG